MAHSQYHNVNIQEQQEPGSEELGVNIINSLEIDLNSFGVSSVTRQISINGNDNCAFNMQIFNSSGQFYDFNTNTFSAGFSFHKNLEVLMSGNFFTTNIVFPENDSGDTYTIFLFTTPDKKTEFNRSISGHKYIVKKTLQQIGNATLTFSPGTVNSSNYKTFATSTLTESSTVTQNFITNIDWTVENVENDSHGFGLRLTDAFANLSQFENYFYFETTDTVDGAISSATQVVVDDLTNLAEGMIITAVSSGGLSGTPKITNINTDTKTLTLSSAQSFADGITLTFRAYGSSQISSSTGIEVVFDSFTAVEPEQLSKTVRGDISGSTTVDLNGTYGIAGGGHVKITGVGVNNNGTNLVQSVSASSSAGSMVVQLNQELVSNTVIYFTGCSRKVQIKGKITTTKTPTTNTTINLDLDKIITVGTAS